MPRLNALCAIGIVLTLTSGATAQTPAPGGDVTADLLNRLILENVRGGASTLTDGVLHLREDGGSARTRRIASDFTLNAEIWLATPASELEIGLRTINVAGGWPGRGHRLRINASTPPALHAQNAKATSVRPATRVPAADTWLTVRVMGSGPRIHVWIDGEAEGVHEIDAAAGALLFHAARGSVDLSNLSFQFPPPEVPPASSYKDRTDFTLPKLTRELKPNYSKNAKNAMDAMVEGLIKYEAVVLTDGSAVRMGIVPKVFGRTVVGGHRGIWNITSFMPSGDRCYSRLTSPTSQMGMLRATSSSAVLGRFVPFPVRRSAHPRKMYLFPCLSC